MPAPRADGPDISHYQTLTGAAPDPSWTVWSHKVTEGRSYKDPTFDARWIWFRQMGFKYRGAYHWVRSDSSMADQVANLKRAIDKHGGLRVGEFIQIDWETTPNIPPLSYAQIQEFQDRVEAIWPGRAIMYTSDWVPNFLPWRNSNPDYPLWYANYNVGTTSTGGWAECERWEADVWQYTSSYTHPCMTARFDMNHVRHFDVLDRITLQNKTPIAVPPVPQPESEADDVAEIKYYALPPAGRPGNPPHLVVADGMVRYRCNFDTAPWPAHELNDEQYDNMLQSAGLRPVPATVNIPNPLPVSVVNFPPPAAGSAVQFPSFTVIPNV
jgi:GH25 family lysozyme M1 (1,4-beta-N-acetylmuramidase)